MSVDKYTKHIAETSYKNIIKNKSNTDSNLAWYEEPDTVTPRVDGRSVWLDSEYIPNSPNVNWVDNLYYATIGNSVVAVLEKFENVEISKLTDKATFFSKKLIDCIQNENYHLTIKDANGDVIPFGLKKWTIDSGVGYLSFTDGMPEGYELPFCVTGYRYCGRKLPEHMITTDGSQQMLSDYEPTEEQSIVTKRYVDTKLSKIEDYVDRMLPPEPDTFEGKDLTFICDNEFDAIDIKTKEHYEHVIINNYQFTVDIPEFYDPEVGTVRLLLNVNGTWREAGKIELSDSGPIAKNLIIDYSGEAYPDSLSSKGFYKKIKCHFSSTLSEMSSIINFHYYPMKFKMSYTYGDTTYYSNDLIVCEELPQETDALQNETIILSTNAETFGYKYISGILTPRAGDIISMSSLNHKTLKKFTKGTHISKVDAFGLEYERFPELTYAAYNPPLEIKEDLVIPKGIYQEVTTIDAETYNVFGEVNGEHHTDYNFRVDTISDESRRVYSGEVQNQMIVNSCGEWDPQADLRNNNELQMLAGKYQWPEKDFSINGTGLIANSSNDASWIKTGLNYSECLKSGKRYVTLRYDMKIANGIFINFEDAENITQDKDTHAFNVDSMYIKVAGSTDWLDAKEPYDGVGANNKWMQGCLAVQNSEEGKIYCTFGPKPIEGILYIRIGVRYDQHIKFRDITIKENI